MNYFKRSGRYYTSYSQRIWDDIRTSIDRGEKVWECQFEYIEDFYRMLQAIDRDDMYADIVGEHLQKIGYTGTYATITSEKEEMSCIACWF